MLGAVYAGAVDTAVGFADRHGIVSLLLVATPVAGAVAIWRVWVFVAPLLTKWIESQIEVNERNAKSLELIAANNKSSLKLLENLTDSVDWIMGKLGSKDSSK